MRLAQSGGTESEIDEQLALKYPITATAIEDYLINCLDTKDHARNFPPNSADRYFQPEFAEPFQLNFSSGIKSMSYARDRLRLASSVLVGISLSWERQL